MATSPEEADCAEAAHPAHGVGGTAIASPTEPEELRTVFARDGVAMVPGAFDPHQAAAMRQRFWRYVERNSDIRERDPGRADRLLGDLLPGLRGTRSPAG